jgi:pimeloyl-ACP methyl ester carboxylesterase
MLKIFETNTLLQNVSSWSAAMLEQARTFGLDWSDLNKIRNIWLDSSFEAKAKAGESLYHAFIKGARRVIGAEVHEVELNDGVVHYWTTNKRDRETVLFLHGFADSKDSAYSLAIHLFDEFNVMAIDLPGFGHSFANPELAYDTHAYGRWLDEFVSKSGMGPVHVVGNSLGGVMALKLALVRPDVIKSLTLLNSAGLIDLEHESLYDEIMRGENIFQVKTLEEFEKFWSKIFHRQPFLPPFAKEFLFQRFRQNHDWYGELVQRNFGSFTDKRHPDYLELFMNKNLDRIDKPALILWGDRDQLFPVAHGAKGHTLLKDSRFIVLKDVGHAPQVEAPRMVARHLKHFIGGLPKVEPNNS